MSDIYYLAVIGAGASGLVAAAVCSKELLKSKSNEKIVLLEKENKIGKKILATGNGKCNMTNINASANNYYGDIEFAENALQKFSPYDTIKYFNNLGILTREISQGRIYPYTNQAVTIRDILCKDVQRENIDIICDTCVIDINYNKLDKLYTIITNNINIKAKKILFATGGRPNNQKNSNNSIYSIIQNLGHKVTDLFPGLCPVLVKSPYIKNLKGIRHTGKVTLIADNKPLKIEFGEIQFNENNLSGICVFNISRLVNEYITYKTINNTSYKRLKISLDLCADYSFEDLYDFLFNFQSKTYIMGSELLEGLLGKNLSQAVYKSAFGNDIAYNKLSQSEIKTLTSKIKNFVFDINSEYVWKNNQITCGGVSIKSVNPNSFKSKCSKDIYFCGEVLNVDGDCGGYNLQFAFSSGILVGREIANDKNK